MKLCSPFSIILARFQTVFCAALLLLAIYPSSSLAFSGKLVRVLDGDTVEVLREGKAERIRLAEIDAPESNQPFGQASKRFVLEVAAQQIVTVAVRTTDRYGRTVGEVFLPDGRSLNRELVRQGLAWHYKQYSRDASLGELETEARAAKRGLWGDANPVPPWEYRRAGRSTGARQETVSSR